MKREPKNIPPELEREFFRWFNQSGYSSPVALSLAKLDKAGVLVYVEGHGYILPFSVKVFVGGKIDFFGSPRKELHAFAEEIWQRWLAGERFRPYPGDSAYRGKTVVTHYLDRFDENGIGLPPEPFLTAPEIIEKRPTPLGSQCWHKGRWCAKPSTYREVVAEIEEIERGRKEFNEPDYFALTYRNLHEELRAFEEGIYWSENL